MYCEFDVKTKSPFEGGHYSTYSYHELTLGITFPT